MNRFDIDGLPARLEKAEIVTLRPLCMKAETEAGVEKEELAINEVSLLRQSR